ncbi:MAG: hypothetical protein R2695_18710 [Acidimicrobiales bacterium]
MGARAGERGIGHPRRRDLRLAGVADADPDLRGTPIVAAESDIVRAHQLVAETTDLAVSATGTAGLAGLLAAPPPAGSRVGVLFTGVERE